MWEVQHIQIVLFGISWHFFLPNIFGTLLVESAVGEPTDTEGLLYVYLEHKLYLNISWSLSGYLSFPYIGSVVSCSMLKTVSRRKVKASLGLISSITDKVRPALNAVDHLTITYVMFSLIKQVLEVTCFCLWEPNYC